jgi:hypothetical protein
MSCNNSESCLTITVAFADKGGVIEAKVTPSYVLEQADPGHVTIQPYYSASYRFRFEVAERGRIEAASPVRVDNPRAAEFACDAAAVEKGVELAVTARFGDLEGPFKVWIKPPYPKDITPPGPGSVSVAAASSLSGS